jgi:hypothetical protein
LISVDARVAGSGQGGDDVEAVRAVAGRAGLPGAAEVFDLDPDVAGAGLATDGEKLPAAGGVHDGVGGQFARDQDRIVGGRAARQIAGYFVAYSANLVGPAGKVR